MSLARISCDALVWTFMKISNQKLVFITLFLLLLGGVGEHLFYSASTLQASSIDTGGNPTMGSAKAPVQMVIFEDLRCGSCHEFHMDILPHLKKRFIDTGKVQCSLVLLAFLDNSEPLAIEALSRFEENPDSFFSFIDQLYTNSHVPQRAGPSDGRLKAKLQENEELASKLMNDDVATPTVFINGKMTPSYSLGAVVSEIEAALGR